jgi:hypothetical protein
MLLGHLRECAIELVGTSGLQELKLYSQRPGRNLHVSYRGSEGRSGRVREDRHAAELGDKFREQPQLLAIYFLADAVGRPGDVATRAREARDEPLPDRIVGANHDDGNRRRGVLGCHRGRGRRRYDDVHLEANQLGSEVGQPVQPPLRKSIVDDDVLPFDPPELAQPLPEGLNKMWGSGGRAARKITYPVDLPCLLRCGSKRRGEETAR